MAIDPHAPLSATPGLRAHGVPTVLRVELVELLHGTSSRNWTAIQASGEIGIPCPARALAEELEDEFELERGSVFAHQSYEFSRGRDGDPHLYLTQDPQVAERHAHICSEILEDALMAVFRCLHPRTNPYRDPGKEKLERFRADYREKHGLEPVILRVKLPLAKLPIPEGSKVQDPKEWLALATQNGPLNTVAVPEPLPTSYAAVA